MPHKAKRKRNYTQIKNNLSKKYCTKGPKSMANIIVNNAKRIGLNVCVDNVTSGDGNCFYHALLQQLQRSDISIDYHSTHLILNPLPSHLELRTAICEYVQQHQNNIAYIQQYHTLYNDVLYEEYNMTWDDFLIAQTHNGVYATELFIKTAAVLIGINIQITSEYCTPQHPYNIVKSDEETNTANVILITTLTSF